ncbi:hypothetical protein CPC08DRAFT_810154 [Agrocybe pediades]|nr:hypothetical protein CPC08DRAFT_810154 [Agrocybe pediades]
MSTSDNNSVAKVKLLSNSNYTEWCVSGKETKPSDPKEAEKWEIKEEKAAGEIYLLVESDQRVHFGGHEEDPIKIWALLEAAHLSKKPGARFNAYDDLFSIRKQDDEHDIRCVPPDEFSISASTEPV